MAIAVAMLGAFVWFWEVEGADQRATAEQNAKEVFPELKAEDVTALVLQTTDDQAVRLERDAEGWRLREPIDFPADSMAVDALASAVADLVTESVFDNPESLESYGLEGEPVVRATADAREVALTLGDSIPAGGYTYVAAEGDLRDKAAEGDPRVFTVATYRLRAIRKSLDQLRDSRVLDFDRNAVREIEVSWVGGSVALVKGEEAWRLRKPLDAAADEGAIAGLLSDLSFLRAEAYVDEPGESRLAGFEAPAGPTYRVVLRGEEDVVLAELAVAGPDEGFRRVVKGRGGYVYGVSQSRLDDLPRTVIAYRFRELSRFATNDVGRFELEFHEGDEELKVTASQTEEGGWTSEPELLAPGKASRLLSELSRLEATGIAAESMGENELAGLGLAPPNATLRVYPEEGEEPLAELMLGRLEAGRGIAAQRAGDPIVYWLSESLAEYLPVNLEAWRSRFVAKEAAEEASEEEGETEALGGGEEGD